MIKLQSLLTEEPLAEFVFLNKDKIISIQIKIFSKLIYIPEIQLKYNFLNLEFFLPLEDMPAAAPGGAKPPGYPGGMAPG